ncbi:MAG TPA: hypothetical protein VHJ59_00420 [Nitrososphaera sp.]|jgi:hypothetical protein|nr:hypothetical protein [Nitrososphaera sp.]
MTNTILVTVSTGTVGSKEIAARQVLEKDINFLKSGAFSKVRLIFEETREGKPITMRKFVDDYAEEGA